MQVRVKDSILKLLEHCQKLSNDITEDEKVDIFKRK